jgi:hypothetical protein
VKPGRQLALLWGGVALAMVLLSPLAPSLLAGLPPCLFREVTDLPCPGCGTGRAAGLLAAFRFGDAFRSFPLASLAWSLLVGGGLAAGLAALRGWGVPAVGERLARPARWLVPLLIGANWLLLILTGA